MNGVTVQKLRILTNGRFKKKLSLVGSIQLTILGKEINGDVCVELLA